MAKVPERADLVQSPWSQAPKNNAHKEIISTILYLRHRQPAASNAHWAALRMYSGFAADLAYGLTERNKRQIMPRSDDRARLKLNVVRRCVDAVHARITQNKVKLTYLTSGGDWSAQRKAKLTDKMTQGMFYHADAYTVGSEVVRDAEIFGTGIMKVYPDTEGRPKIDRTFPDAISVDDGDGLYRKPRNLYEYHAVDRAKLMADPDFKKFVPQLRVAGMPEDEFYIVGRNQLADQVGLAEAWHLPSFPGAKDGRHVMCVDNVTLIDEPWTFDYFPHIFLRYCTRPLGFWGQGIPEQIAGTQYEINEILEVIQRQMYMSGPKIFIERGSNIVEDHLTNEIWGVIEYSGQAPTFSTFATVSPEYFEHLDRLYNRAFDDIGLSQMMAAGNKPSGLNSAKALITFNDQETSNLTVFGTAQEEMYLELGERCLDIARDTHLRPDANGKKKPFVVMTPVKERGQRFLDKINWGDINLAKDDYQIQVFPTALLPTQPAGRLQAIGDMMDRGMLKGDQAISLLDFPDLEAVNSLTTAPIDNIDWLLEEMLDHGEPMSPEPFDNFDLAIQRMNAHLIRAKLNGYPEERLELVRRYMTMADAMNKAQKAASAPPPAPPGPGGAMAAPALPNGMQPPPPPVQGAPGLAS